MTTRCVGRALAPDRGLRWPSSRAAAAAAAAGPPTIDVGPRHRAGRRTSRWTCPASSRPSRSVDVSPSDGLREDDSRRSRIARSRGPAAGRARSAGTPRPPRRGAVEAAGRGSTARGRRSKADADSSTYERLKAASATPGCRGRQRSRHRAEGRRSRSESDRLGAAERRGGATGPESITALEGYLRVTAPFDGVVTERNVHPGALVGPSGDAPDAACASSSAACASRCPVPEAYIAGVSRRARAMPFTVPAYPGQTFSGTRARFAHRRREDADDGD